MTITNLNDMVELITSLDTKTKILEGYNFAILGYVIEKDHTKVAYSVNGPFPLFPKLIEF